MFPRGSLALAGGAARNSGLLLLVPHIYIYIYKALGLWNHHQLSPHKRQCWLRPSHSKVHQDLASATSLLWPSHKSADSTAVYCPPLGSSQADKATYPLSSLSASHYSSIVIVTVISTVITSAFVVTLFCFTSAMLNTWGRLQHRFKGWQISSVLTDWIFYMEWYCITSFSIIFLHVRGMPSELNYVPIQLEVIIKYTPALLLFSLSVLCF